MNLQQGALPVAERKSRTFLNEVVCEAIYTAFGKLSAAVSRCFGHGQHENAVGYTDCWSHLLAARLACVLVAIARIFEFGAALEELENQLVRPSAHSFLAALSRGFGVAEILPSGEWWGLACGLTSPH